MDERRRKMLLSVRDSLIIACDYDTKLEEDEFKNGEERLAAEQNYSYCLGGLEATAQILADELGITKLLVLEQAGILIKNKWANERFERGLSGDWEKRAIGGEVHG